jgi:hypothetical protein
VLFAGVLLQCSCSLMLRTFRTGGEEQLKPAATASVKGGPRVIIFALDGTGPAPLLEAIRSGKAPHIASLLGAEKGADLFEHAYAAPRALTILPSSTIAAWAAIFTGKPPALNGVPGDEWFVRETVTFHAPVPVSVRDTLDVTKVVDDDLVGKSLKVPTLFHLVGRRSHVSLLSVHDGATLYTTIAPAAFVDVVRRLISGTMGGDNPEHSLSAGIDLVSQGKNASPYEVFDGQKLVPIHDYLTAHPRPDLIHLEKRMNELSAGPYGNRAGDILLLARACANVPVDERYVFAASSHYTWHGSACWEDGHVPFILARQGGSGDELRTLMTEFGGASPSVMALTPLVRELFRQ